MDQVRAANSKIKKSVKRSKHRACSVQQRASNRQPPWAVKWCVRAKKLSATFPKRYKHRRLRMSSHYLIKATSSLKSQSWLRITRRWTEGSLCCWKKWTFRISSTTKTWPTLSRRWTYWEWTVTNTFSSLIHATLSRLETRKTTFWAST